MATKKRKKLSKPAPDFEKRKRKFGKGSKTGDNVTSISFKSRNVVVPSQLERTLPGPTTHRKQNIQVLLQQLKHHNSTVRYNALTGLREMFHSYSELVHPNLPKLVQLVFSTAMDVLPNVRQASYSLVKDLMSGQLTHTVIRPFFSTIVAQLTCGLTSISENIQFDSLRILDLYIQHQPDLLVSHIGKLLPLLMSLLSRHKMVRCLTQSEPSGLKRNRKGDALKLRVATTGGDPSSKLLNMESRLRILGMLCKLLDTVLGSLGSDGSGTTGTSCSINISEGKVYAEADITRQKDMTHSSICCLGSAMPHVPIIHTHGVVITDRSALGSTSSSLTIADLFPDYCAFLRVLDTLCTLALESWVEWGPARVFSAKSATMSHVELVSKLVDVLHVTVKIVMVVQACKSNLSFQNKDGRLTNLLQRIVDGISSHVVCDFPFSISGSSRKEEFDKLHYSTNFTFCHLLMLLRNVSCSMVKGDQGSNLTVVATEYLSNFEVVAMKRLASSSQVLQNCTAIIVEMVPVLWEMSEERMDDTVCLVGVFKFLRDFYAFCHPRSSSKHLMMRSLGNVFAREAAGRGLARGSSVMMDELLLPWSISLLELLPELGDSCPETCCIVIDAIATAVRHGNPAITDSLHLQLVPLFGPKNVLQGVPGLTKRRAVELIWYLPSLAVEELSLLGRFVTSGHQDVGIVKYLIQTVHQKFVQENESGSFVPCLPAYLSFMVTILLGCSREELKDLSASSNREYGLCDTRVLVVRKISGCEAILDVHKTVCEYLSAGPLGSSDLLLCLKLVLLEIVAPPLRQALPVDTVCGLLLLGCSFGPSCSAALPDLVPAFAQLCVSAIAAAEGVADEEATTAESREHAQLMSRCLKLSHTMLGTWRVVLEAVVVSLGHELSSCCSDSSDMAKKCLLTVLLLPDLRPNLLASRDRLRALFLEVLQSLGASDLCGIDKELKLAANEYL